MSQLPIVEEYNAKQSRQKTDVDHLQSQGTSASTSNISLLGASALCKLDTSANIGPICIFGFVMLIPGILLGYSLSYTNQLEKMFDVKFSWDKQESGVYQGMIGASVVVGLMVGSQMSGMVIKRGRRNAIIFGILMGMIACLSTIDRNFYVIIIARFFFGTSVGIINGAAARFIEENVPSQLYEVFSPMVSIGYGFGTIISFSLAFLLPKDDDISGLEADQRWKIIYAYVPIGIYSLMLIGLLTYVREDPIKFLIQQGDDKQAIIAIRKYYKYAKNDEKAYEYLRYIASLQGESSSGVTMWQALADPEYRQSTWVNVANCFFHEVAGINVINLYSNQIFSSGSSNLFTPRFGTLCLGFGNTIGALMSVPAIKSINRRTLLLGGQVAFFVVHAFIGYMSYIGSEEGVLLGIFVFLLAYNMTSGPIAWVYAAETSVDVGLGFILMTLYGDVVVLSQICPILFEPQYIGPSGVFFMFSGFGMIGILFVWVYIKETRGLSDKEKKAIYKPKDREIKVGMDYKS